jgi:hypothetical protein
MGYSTPYRLESGKNIEEYPLMFLSGEQKIEKNDYFWPFFIVKPTLHFAEGLLRTYLVVLKCYMRKCRCADVYVQMTLRKCPCANVHSQMSIRKRPCANVHSQMSVR